jgi:hypothetical protein
MHMKLVDADGAAPPAQSDDLVTRQSKCTDIAVQEVSMQQGSIIKAERKHGPAVWQFRWPETGSQGRRIYRKRVVGTIEDYADSEAVREAFRSLIPNRVPRDCT